MANCLSDVREANKRLIYQCIRENKQITLTELERMTSLSRPTIVSLVRTMEAEGHVIQNGQRPSSGGRSPMLYSINARAFYAMGIDFEFPTVRMAISDLEGELLFSSTEKYPVDAHKDEVLKLLCDQIEALLVQSEIDRGLLLGIGLGIGGVIDRKANHSVILERITGWEDVPIGQILSDRFCVPIHICNDVDLLAMAERTLCPQNTLPDMLFIAIRFGIGMAIVSNDQFLQGEGGNIGRLGHMLVDTDGPECACGSRGCLGLYTSERAMRGMYRKLTGRELRHMSDIIRFAQEGESAALSVLEEAGHYLGIGIVNVCNLFDTSHVVLSAPFPVDILLGNAEPALIACNTHKLQRKITVRQSALKEENYALGGCLLLLELARLEQRSMFEVLF